MKSVAEIRTQLFPAQVPLAVTAVHDESGIYKADRYFVTGFVFVPDSHLQGLLADLRRAREKHDYWGEIHYSRLSQIDGRWGAKFRTASDWMDALEARMVEGATMAKILAVDLRAPTYEHDRFRGRRHFAYNRFTRMALEAGIRWCFDDAGAIRIRLLSDAKSRRPGGDDEDPAEVDNFARYLPRVVARRAGAPGWPAVSFLPDLVEEVAPGGRHEDCEPECELIQVADLVVSSVAAAIRGPSLKPGKRQPAQRAARWVREGERGRGRPPRMWRRFSCSVFVPGAARPWPEPVPLAIDPGVLDGQLALL